MKVHTVNEYRKLMIRAGQAEAALQRVRDLIDPINGLAVSRWDGDDRLFAERQIREALEGDE